MSANVIRFPALLTEDDGRVTYGCTRWRNAEVAIQHMTPRDFDRTLQWSNARQAWEDRHNGGSEPKRGGGSAA
jgi:hypothetical protein